MNIMITGGLGYIGSWLAKRLLNEGHHVTIVDNATAHDLKKYDKARTPLERAGAVVVIDDARNLNSSILKGTDIVFHLAAISGIKACEHDAHGSRLVNTKLTAQMLNACQDARVKTMVFTSTAAVYADAQKCMETGETIPQNRYAKTKLLAERELEGAKNVKVVIARLSNVFGHGYYDKKTVVSNFVRGALKDETLWVYGNGEQVRDFVHINDVVDGLIFLTNATAGIYNLGSGRTLKVRDLASKVIKKTQSKSVLINKHTDSIEPQEGYKYVIDKIKKEGWKPKMSIDKGIVQLAEGILDDK